MKNRSVRHAGRLAVGKTRELFVWAWVVASLVPIIFIVMTSFKSTTVATAIPPRWTFRLHPGNYVSVWNGAGGTVAFKGLMLHSVIVTATVTLITIVVSIMASYALCLRELRRRHFVSSWILSTYMFPPIVAVVPLYFTENRLRLLGSYPGVIVPEIAANIPIAILLLRGAIAGLPREIGEAAAVDGCSEVGTLVRMVVPLVAPVVATATILTVILSWNEFIFASSLTSSATETLPVSILSFTGMYGTEWGLLSAASVIVSAPVVVLALVLRRRLVSGLTLGAVR